MFHTKPFEEIRNIAGKSMQNTHIYLQIGNLNHFAYYKTFGEPIPQDIANK